MKVFAIVSFVVALISIFILIAYRRQIKKICRHLAFFNSHKSNIRLTVDVPMKEIKDLTEQINDTLDKVDNVRITSQNNEINLKQTITNLSHDIRTPLTSLDGYFQLLSDSDTDEEREHYINIIQSRITSLKEILEELFTYTKLQDENYELALAKTDISKALYDAAFSFYEDFKSRNIEPTLEIEDGIFVNGNTEALRRIFQNIIKNGLEHGTNDIKIKIARKNNFAVFICSNDVKNTEEIDVSKVFTRFYKADSARTQASTGLGLSIAKGLVEKMGGEISASIQDGNFVIKINFPIIA